MLAKKTLFCILFATLGVCIILFINISISIKNTPITLPAQKDKPHTTNHKTNKYISDNDKTTFSNFLKKRLGPGTSKDSVFHFLNIWMKKKPKDVLHFILKMKRETLQTNTLTLAIEIWHKNNPTNLSQWFINKKPNKALSTFCTSSTIIPEACIYYIEKANNIELKNDIIQFQLLSWVTNDTENAILWSAKSKQNFERFGLDVYRYSIHIDFDTALYHLPTINSVDSTAAPKIADIIIKELHLSTTNTESFSNSAAEAILSLSESQFKDTLLLSLTPKFFKFGSTHNNMILIESMANNATRESLQHNFVSGLVLKQGALFALEYLDQLNDEDKNQQLITTILMAWGEKNLVEAYEWQKSREEITTHTNISLIQMAIRQKNTPIAIELIESIKRNLGSTYDTIEYDFQIAKLIYEKNPASGIDYLRKNTKLSSEEKDSLVKYFIDQQATN